MKIIQCFSLSIFLVFSLLVQAASIQAAEDEKRSRPGLFKTLIIGYLLLSEPVLSQSISGKRNLRDDFSEGKCTDVTSYDRDTTHFNTSREALLFCESRFKGKDHRTPSFFLAVKDIAFSEGERHNAWLEKAKQWGSWAYSCFPSFPNIPLFASAEVIDCEYEDKNRETCQSLPMVVIDETSGDNCKDSEPVSFPQTVAVIGGGYTGIISSLLLAKLRTPTDSPVFDVHLFEKDLVLMNGASIAPARLHLGGEYPKDKTTANQCLYSALLFRQMFQTESVLTSRKHIDFLLAEASIRAGNLTLAELRDHYEELQKIYRKSFKQLKRDWKKETATRLFGTPDEFFHFLDSLKAIDKPLQHHFAGGVRTSERGFQPIALEVILERLLSQSNVYIHLGHQITDAGYVDGEGYQLETLLTSDGPSREFFANYVVNAAWHEIPYLNNRASKGDLTSTNQPTKVFLRSIGLFDVSGCKGIPKDRSYFGLIGKNGGMVSFFSPNVAIIYMPEEGLSYQGEHYLHDHIERKSSLDSSAEISLQKLINNRATYGGVLINMLGSAESIYPFLTNAKPIILLSRTTISWDNETYQRQHIQAGWPMGEKRRWLQAYSTKATFAPFTALQVLEQMASHCSISGRVKFSNGAKDFLKSALSTNFSEMQSFNSTFFKLPWEFTLFNGSLSEDSEFMAEMQLYVLKRQLPLSMIEGVKKPSSSTFPHEQIHLMDWKKLKHVDLRTVNPSPEIFTALKDAIVALRYHSFESLRLRYYPKNEKTIVQGHVDAWVGLLKALQGRSIKELEINQLYLASEDEVDALADAIQLCNVQKLVLTEFGASSTKLLDPFLSFDLTDELKEVMVSFKESTSKEVVKKFFGFLGFVPKLEKLRIPQTQLGKVLDDRSKAESLQPVVSLIKRIESLVRFDLYGNDLFESHRLRQKHSVFDAILDGNLALVVDLRRNGLTSAEEKEWSFPSESRREKAWKKKMEKWDLDVQRSRDSEWLRNKMTDVMMNKSPEVRSLKAELEKERAVINIQRRDAERRLNEIERLKTSLDYETLFSYLLKLFGFKVTDEYEMLQLLVKEEAEINNKMYQMMQRVERLEEQTERRKMKIIKSSYEGEDMLYRSESLSWLIRPLNLRTPTIFVSYCDEQSKRKFGHLLTNLNAFHFRTYGKMFYVSSDGKKTVELDHNRDITIDSADRVIVVGSPELKRQYDQRPVGLKNKSSFIQEIDAIRLRDSERRENGIIPIYLSEDCTASEVCFPRSLRHIKARSFDKRDYFYSFISLVKELYGYQGDMNFFMERYFAEHNRKYV